MIELDEIVPLVHQFLDDTEHISVPTIPQNIDNLEVSLVLDAARHPSHRLDVERSTREGEDLIEHRQRIAHTAVGLAGDEPEGVLFWGVPQFQEVWVLTGPLFETAMPDLINADEPHTVPSAYWKIVYIEQGNGIRAGAFIMEQAISGSLADQITTIDDIETRSGLTFFPELTSLGNLKTDPDGDWVIQ